MVGVAEQRWCKSSYPECLACLKNGFLGTIRPSVHLSVYLIIRQLCLITVCQQTAIVVCHFQRLEVAELTALVVIHH